jgi:hypothetical protein
MGRVFSTPAGVLPAIGAAAREGAGGMVAEGSAGRGILCSSATARVAFIAGAAFHAAVSLSWLQRSA